MGRRRPRRVQELRERLRALAGSTSRRTGAARATSSRSRESSCTLNTPIFVTTARSRRPTASRRSRSTRSCSTTTTTSRAWIVDDLRRDRAAARPRLGRRRAALPQARDRRRLEAALLNAGIPCRLALGTRARRRSGRRLRDRGAARDRATEDDVFATPFFRRHCCQAAVRRGARARRREPARSCGSSSAASRSSAARRTRRRDRFAARSPTGAISRRSARTTRRSARSCRISCRDASASCARCSTTATTRSATPRRFPMSSRSRPASRDARDGRGRSGCPASAASRSPSRAFSAAIGIKAVAVRRRASGGRRTSCGPETRRRSGSRSACSRPRSCSRWTTSATRSAISRRSISRRPTTTPTKAEIVEIAAVRVRGGQIVETFDVARQAARRRSRPARRTTHGISDADVASPHTSRRSGRASARSAARTSSLRTTATTSTFRILQRMVARHRCGRAIRPVHVRHAAARARPLSDEPEARGPGAPVRHSRRPVAPARSTTRARSPSVVLALDDDEERSRAERPRS